MKMRQMRQVKGIKETAEVNAFKLFITDSVCLWIALPIANFDPASWCTDTTRVMCFGQCDVTPMGRHFPAFQLEGYTLHKVGRLPWLVPMLPQHRLIANIGRS